MKALRHLLFYSGFTEYWLMYWHPLTIIVLIFLCGYS